MTASPLALKDSNSVSALLACLNTDTVQGTHLVAIAVNPTSHGIKINTIATISFTMKPIDAKDVNYSACWAFEGTDGLLYPAVATSIGELLVNMTS